MKVSYQWLKEFVDLRASPEEAAASLTHVGLALDGFETAGDDRLLELDVATNRPDCLCHLGVARELSVIYDCDLRVPGIDLREAGTHADDVFSISIADPDLCGRYCGRYLEGVRIGPSPDWLRDRLEALGVRSINNVADVTNYVMLELGQPLHAFDADTLEGRQIIVRRAELDETLTTLDGIERRLNPSTLLIADAGRGVAIAGVMGGAETEISSRTTNVLLESANFNALSIRKTSRALGLTSEASYRFERGADIVMARFACDRAAALIQQLAGGEIFRGVIDVYPGRAAIAPLQLRRSRVQAFLGAPVGDNSIERIFSKLGFGVTRTADGWTLLPPSHRTDIAIEEDLLDEVARHHGFDKFPATLPAWSGSGSGLPSESAERALRNRLSAAGYTEIIPMAFSDEAMERRFRPDVEPVKLLNPIAEDQAVLRTSLMSGMLRTIQWNMNRGIRDLQLYELGKTYRPGFESRSLILAATGALRQKSVHDAPRDFDFYDLKSDVEDILNMFDIQIKLSREKLPGYYHPGRAARWDDMAAAGELHPEFTDLFKLKHRVYIAEMEIESLLTSRRRHQAEGVPRYPSIRRDFSLLFDKGTRYEDVRAAIAAADIPELVRVEPFDRMENGPFPDSKYSLSISMIYQSPERTLTDAEVEKFDQHILGLLEQRLRAQLRK